MTHADQTESKPYYDLEELQAIPVRSICEAYGVKPTKNKRMFIAPGGEKDGSLYLYEGSGQNRFWDFGRNIGGGPIEFVAYICNLDWKDAVKNLAETFGIQPIGRERNVSYELSDRQWSKIGIHGDLATKNFYFDFNKPHAIKRNEAISKKYNMTVNELRKKNPGVYKSVLEKRAFSYMYARQQQYFNELSAWYLAMQSGGYESFDKITPAALDEMQKMVDELRTEVLVLKQALKGTDLDFNFYPFDIDKDFQKIVSGEIEMEVGSVSSYDLKNYEKYKNLDLKETVISASVYESLLKLHFSFPYAAIQSKDCVNIIADKEQIPLFENAEKYLIFGIAMEIEEETLDNKIQGAMEKSDVKDTDASLNKDIER